MLISELKKSDTYIYIDKKIPLKFTGISEEKNQFNSVCKVAIFNPIKTELNKNWIKTSKKINVAFSENSETKTFENFYIKPLKK
ncbi:hypothetical protein [Polaribacter sp.]|uniref:hypothetical protein n=1 Tax=Polaribacter sp. TaxID=1920175 RepID=UPI003F6C4450